MAHAPAAVVYAEQLVSRGHGHPLWHPEPFTSFGAVELGDVGYVSEGAFVRLFNALRSAQDRANARGVPQGFAPFLPDASPRERRVPAGPICNASTSFRQESDGSSGPRYASHPPS